jgi:hypothetical protein
MAAARGHHHTSGTPPTAFFDDAFVTGDVGLQKPDVDVFHFVASSTS